MAAHSSILAWRIPWTEEPGGLQSRGCKESDTTERLSTQPSCREIQHILVVFSRWCANRTPFKPRTLSPLQKETLCPSSQPSPGAWQPLTEATAPPVLGISY